MAPGVPRSWLVAFPCARALAHQIDVLRVPHTVGADQSNLRLINDLFIRLTGLVVMR